MLTVLLVIAGLLTNFLIYDKTFTKGEKFSPNQGLCSVPDKSNVNAQVLVDVSAGAPLQSTKSYKDRTEDGSMCSADLINRSNTIQFVSSWQFFADWIIWTLAWSGLFFVLVKLKTLDAHIRH